ncbi:inactive Ufm1-specific protease 1 isoform X1 [Heterodontus francisci]|uniref:inactive Ufm1-specific protease 1 isoform X1 n=2 Tax=Heterodontus francisci TaxID=7792 RepID=UPI00355B9FD7
MLLPPASDLQIKLLEDQALGMELVKNIHSGLPLPEPESDIHRQSLIRGDYLYYHYGCDGTDDCGWGCGYRTMQTLSSWIILQQTNIKNHRVPTLKEVQEALVEMEDKPPNFIDSKTWIGSFEIALCIDKFYDVPCKLVHARQGGELLHKVKELYLHFDTLGSPVMMGGDNDNASKGILGMCTGSENHYLLVLDPHYSGKTLDKEYAQRKGWVAWKKLDLFDQNSFYNFCLPQCKGV